MNEEREPIWTVPADWRETYFILFNVQIIIGLGLITWNEATSRRASDNFVDVLVAVCESMAPVIITIAAVTIALVEALRMLSERYLRRRYRQGKEEGREEGREEGLAEGQRRMEEWARQLIEDGLLPPDVEIPYPDSNGKKDDR